jgi:hypothetical protein
MQNQNSKLSPKEQFYARFKKVEIALLAISLFAILIKVSMVYILFLNAVLIISLSSLSIFSFLFAFSEDLIYDIKNKQLALLMGLASSLLALGCLFAFMFWPGGRVFTLGGLVLGFASLVWIVVTLEKQTFGLESIYNKMLLAKILILGAFGIWIVLSSPIERFKQFHLCGKDPKAVQLFVDHIDDIENIEKRNAYLLYIRSNCK